MTYRLVGDSCSDISDSMRADEHFDIVPLTLEIGDYRIQDDENFDRLDFIKRVAESPIGAKTACPSPELFKKAYECDADMVFVVTLAEPLSGTYQSAVLAKQMYEEEHGKKNIFVINSISASSGQYLLLKELERLCKAGLSFEDICEKIIQYREGLRTYFVLETLETLRKNGRLSGLAAFFATTLNIKPVMGSKDGEIIKLDQVRGINKALSRMVDILIKESNGKTKNLSIVIAHCNNQDRAKLVEKMIRERADFKEIIITETAGVATVYACDGGIILAVA